MYNFYFNNLAKKNYLNYSNIHFFKTHIKLIVNMYNLFSKFYQREREREREREITCDGELENTTTKRMNPKQSFKNHT